jgi:hypothetical protein
MGWLASRASMPATWTSRWHTAPLLHCSIAPLLQDTGGCAFGAGDSWARNAPGIYRGAFHPWLFDSQSGTTGSGLASSSETAEAARRIGPRCKLWPGPLPGSRSAPLAAAVVRRPARQKRRMMCILRLNSRHQTIRVSHSASSGRVESRTSSPSPYRVVAAHLSGRFASVQCLPVGNCESARLTGDPLAQLLVHKRRKVQKLKNGSLCRTAFPRHGVVFVPFAIRNMDRGCHEYCFGSGAPFRPRGLESGSSDAICSLPHR